jgi:hypothetical protein
MEWVLWARRLGVALLCAEGLLILASTKSITICIKRPGQRTPAESKLVARGLVRELLCEVLIFVPVSVVLASIVVRPILAKIPALSDANVDGMVGMISYGFPYRTLKMWALRACAKFLKEAAVVADQQVLSESSETEDSGAANA